MTEKSRPFGWVTSAADGREHAVPDPDPAGPDPDQIALCGHRVLPRRCSLLVPPGPRCEPCARARRPAAAHTRPLARALDYIRDATKSVTP